jgi:toxin-antitoxin system PIN domain toxin
VILIDANLLIVAHMAGPNHAAALTWLEDRLWGAARVGLPWPSLLAFLRVVTNARAFSRPEKLPAAWAQVRDWLSSEAVWTPEPTDGHAEILERLLRQDPGGGTRIPDAHLAALAIEHGLTLCTLAAGFARYPGLRWENPLSGSFRAR